jgi:cytochrome b involved in lipid metabolism
MENLSIFDLILGLPVHPLVVHLVVVFLPVFSLALIFIIFFPNFRKTYGPLVMAGLLISVAAAFVAKQSGEALSQRVGWPTNHANLGSQLLLISGGLFAVAITWYWLQSKRKDFWIKYVAYLAALVAVAALVSTYLTGHSGATASWSKRLNPPTPASEIIKGTASESGPQILTMEYVAQRNTVNNCLVVVSDTVYDLSNYDKQHPGGAINISNLCGTDATSAFANQHGSQARPNNELKSRILGTLGATISPTSPTVSPSGASSSPAAKAKSASQVLTLAEVATHNTKNNCWAVIKSNVYNLTNYMTAHPGGAANILGLCGKDGSVAFANQHNTQAKPNNTLSGFILGTVSADKSNVQLPVATSSGEEGDD